MADSKSRVNWIYPLRHDPRNVTCAEVARLLVTIQMVFIVFGILVSIVQPTGGGALLSTAKANTLIIVSVVTLPLIIIGLRGFVSGVENQFSSALLVGINGFFFHSCCLGFHKHSN